MSDRVEVICPHCRKKSIAAVIYVVENVCNSCGKLFDLSGLRKVRDAQLARYVPRERKAR